MAHYQPQGFQQWGGRVERIVASDVVFTNHTSESAVNILGAPRANIYPPDADDLSSAGHLVFTRNLRIDSQLREFIHLHCPSRMNQFWNQILIADIVPSFLTTTLVP